MRKKKNRGKKTLSLIFSVCGHSLILLRFKISTSVETNTSHWSSYRGEDFIQYAHEKFSKFQIYRISSPLLYFCCYQDLNGTWIFEAHESKSSSFNLLSERHSFPLKNSNNRDQHFRGFSLRFLIWISPESQIIQQLLTLPLRILRTLPTSRSIRHWWLFLLSF